MCEITGMPSDTIRRGYRELDIPQARIDEHKNAPSTRVRYAHLCALAVYISIKWAAQPLPSFDLMLNFMRDTTTTGLAVEAYFSDHHYQLGIKVSDHAMAALHLY